jgi:RNA polymerase sigma factor (sigma-70 family)
MSETHSQTNFLNTGFQASSDEETERLAGTIMEELRKIVWSNKKKTPDSFEGVPLEDVVQELFLKLRNTAQASGVGEGETGPATGEPRKRWNDRKHFYRCAAIAVRNLRVDYARRRKAMHLDSRFSWADSGQPQPSDDLARAEQLLRLDEALRRLAQSDAEAAAVVELRFFGIRPPASSEQAGPPVDPTEGLTFEEIGEQIGKSKATAFKAWSRAQRFLRQVLGTEFEEGQS